MDRFSLGIAVHQTVIRACLFNVETMSVTYTVRLPIQLKEGPHAFIEMLEALFQRLSLAPNWKQVSVIKVTSDANIAVLLQESYYKALVTLNGYTKSLQEQFQNCFSYNRFVLPCEIRNEVSTKVVSESSLISKKSWFYVLKDFAVKAPEKLEETKIVQSLGSFVTSLLAGKRASVDVAFALSSGLSTDGLHWSNERANCVQQNVKEKLDPINEDFESFSYVSSYFVEKYGLYREVRLLPAGCNTAMITFATKSSVFLDTDDGLTLGALVRELPDAKEGYFINGLSEDKFICLVACEFDAYICASSFANAKLQFKQIEKIPICSAKQASNKKEDVVCDSIILSWLLALKENSRPFEQISVVGEFAQSGDFLQFCADLFVCEIVVYEHSEYASAIGCAISGARKIRECRYEEIFHLFFSVQNIKYCLPSQLGCEMSLNLLHQFRNFKLH